jgi:hypothetical protein
VLAGAPRQTTGVARGGPNAARRRFVAELPARLEQAKQASRRLFGIENAMFAPMMASLWLVPFSGPVLAARLNTEISRDAGIRRVLVAAIDAGRVFDGEVPPAVRRDLAAAFATIAGWPLERVLEYLNGPARHADGREGPNWDTHQGLALLENPAKFLLDEATHATYVLVNPVEHYLQHRMAGLKAFLEGRVADGLALQQIGDQNNTVEYF